MCMGGKQPQYRIVPRIIPRRILRGEYPYGGECTYYNPAQNVRGDKPPTLPSLTHTQKTKKIELYPSLELYRDGSQLSLLQPTLLNNPRTVIRIEPPPTRSIRVA